MLLRTRVLERIGTRLIRDHDDETRLTPRLQKELVSMFKSKQRKDLEGAIQDFSVAYAAEVHGFGTREAVQVTSQRVLQASSALRDEEGEQAIQKALKGCHSFVQGTFVGTEPNAHVRFMEQLERMLS